MGGGGVLGPRLLDTPEPQPTELPPLPPPSYICVWIRMVGFRIPLAGFRNPDSKAVDSGFHIPKLPGFRILEYLTWGDKLFMSPTVQINACKFEIFSVR